MKLTIKHPDSCPIATRPQRRILATLDFQKHGNDPLSTFELGHVLVPVDTDGSLVLESSYTSSNRVLSLIVGYQTGKGETKVFSAICEFYAIPVYFSDQLPTGQFIEFYFDFEHGKIDP